MCLRIFTSGKFVYASRLHDSGANIYIDQANVVNIGNLLASILLFVGEGYLNYMLRRFFRSLNTIPFHQKKNIDDVDCTRPIR